MKPAPTLIDEVYRRTFAKDTNPGWKSNIEVRRAIESARRFVVDDAMAAFMAELANESFLKAGLSNGPVVHRIADSLRVQARLPHETIWIEYPLRVYQKRANEIRATKAVPSNEVPWREGWLLQQHPKIETATIMHLWTQNDDTDPADEHGYKMWTFPFAFGWCADDNPLPWRMALRPNDKPHHYSYASAYTVGLADYNRDNVGCVLSPLISNPDLSLLPAYKTLLTEWMGVIRRVWALLATIDNIPIVRGEIRQSKGFLARGNIKRYLDHHTITLTVPFKQDTRVLARRLIAIAHRKRHEVRAFWRDDWRHPPGKCDPHLWEFRENADHIECTICGGRQTFIHKHMRGSGALGLITHDYAVRKGDAA